MVIIKFKFKLEKVLTVRKIKEKTIINQLIQARKQQKTIKKQLNKLISRQEDIYIFLSDNHINLKMMIYAQQYLDGNRQQINKTQQKLVRQKNEVSIIQEKLIAARRAREVMEKLKERSQEKFYNSLIKQEQKQIDEIAGSCYNLSGKLT